jgi:hypothetical protein
MNSNKHRGYAKNTRNFVNLDKFFIKLQRELLISFKSSSSDADFIDKGEETESDCESETQSDFSGPNSTETHISPIQQSNFNLSNEQSKELGFHDIKALDVPECPEINPKGDTNVSYFMSTKTIPPLNIPKSDFNNSAVVVGFNQSTN